MKKDFLTITPESGGEGTASVSAVADPNLLAKERSTTINFSATGEGGLSRAVTAIQDPAFVYHILSNLCNFEDSANSGYKVENGIFVIPLQWQDTHFKLKVFNPFSVITSVTAKYFDEYGIGESLGDDTFLKDGLVWIPNILEEWKNELPNEPSIMKVELYFNGTLAVRITK
jgi:hypothetical protein